MKLDKQYEFVLAGLAIALAIFIVPSFLRTFVEVLPSVWPALIGSVSVSVLYLGVVMLQNSKRLDPQAEPAKIDNNNKTNR